MPHVLDEAIASISALIVELTNEKTILEKEKVTLQIRLDGVDEQIFELNGRLSNLNTAKTELEAYTAP